MNRFVVIHLYNMAEVFPEFRITDTRVLAVACCLEVCFRLSTPMEFFFTKKVCEGVYF